MGDTYQVRSSRYDLQDVAKCSRFGEKSLVANSSQTGQAVKPFWLKAFRLELILLLLRFKLVRAS
eukprot:4306815-Amphidinium_carterae.2